MLNGSSYGWIYLSSLGLGLFLTSLIRKRHFFWIGFGFFLILISQGGAFLTSLYETIENMRELLIVFVSLSVLFFLLSLKLTMVFPTLLILLTFYFIYWGSSGIFSLEKGVYPVRIVSYPTTDMGRSYNIRYADGRESTLVGAGDYLVLERAEWNRFHVFLPRKSYPVGFVPQGIAVPVDKEKILKFTFESPLLLFRPGLRRDFSLIGPINDDLFYTYWLINPENPYLSSVESWEN